MASESVTLVGQLNGTYAMAEFPSVAYVLGLKKSLWDLDLIRYLLHIGAMRLLGCLSNSYRHGASRSIYK